MLSEIWITDELVFNMCAQSHVKHDRPIQKIFGRKNLGSKMRDKNRRQKWTFEIQFVDL